MAARTKQKESVAEIAARLMEKKTKKTCVVCEHPERDMLNELKRQGAETALIFEVMAEQGYFRDVSSKTGRVRVRDHFNNEKGYHLLGGEGEK